MTQINSRSSSGGNGHHNLTILPTSLVRSRKKKKKSCFCGVIPPGPLSVTLVVIVMTIALFWGLSSDNEGNSDSNSNLNSNANKDLVVQETITGIKGSSGSSSGGGDGAVQGLGSSDGGSNPILEGTVGDNNIAYYHQLSTTAQEHHLVLLHGAAFTKEDWKSSGILTLMKNRFPTIAITALDLPVSADYHQLVNVLESMKEDAGLIYSWPISALVTPSASGKSITSWITAPPQDDSSNSNNALLPLTKLPEYIRRWIPVASYSVSTCNQEELEAVANLSLLSPQFDFDVFAIYGNQDGNGKLVTTQLAEYANAKTLELPGRHPVYLDSPEMFAKAVGSEIIMTKEWTNEYITNEHMN